MVSEGSTAPRSRTGGAHDALVEKSGILFASDYIVSLCGADLEIGLSWRLLLKKVHDVCAFREQNVVGTRRSYGHDRYECADTCFHLHNNIDNKSSILKLKD